MPVESSIRANRAHRSSHCLAGDTPILVAGGRARPLRKVRAGDLVVGTMRSGRYRRYVNTEVLERRESVERAHRVTLADGTVLVASADHRFLTKTGEWRHVVGSQHGPMKRPHLTLRSALMGVGALAEPPVHDEPYRRGYLCGIIRTAGSLEAYRGRHGVLHSFRLDVGKPAAVLRARSFLADLGVEVSTRAAAAGGGPAPEMSGISAEGATRHNAIARIVEWPDQPTETWWKGFLAGAFDGAGAWAHGLLRVAIADGDVFARLERALRRFAFDYVADRPTPASAHLARVRGGLAAQLRFSLLLDPATATGEALESVVLKCGADLRIVAIDDLGIEVPMIDIATATADFIANGVVARGCPGLPGGD